MNEMDFSVFEQAIYENNMDKSALDEELSNHIINELGSLCIESLNSGDHAMLKSVAQSKKSLEKFLQGIERDYGSLCWATSSTQIFNDVAWELLSSQRNKKRGHTLTVDDVELIKNSFELFSGAAPLISYLNLDSVNPSFYSKNTPLFTTMKWSDHDIAMLYALGAALDTSTQSFMHYTNIPEHILTNPILASMHREFASYDTATKDVTILPDELKLKAFTGRPAHSIVYGIAGDRLASLRSENGIADADHRKSLFDEGTNIEFKSTFYAEYIDYMTELVSYAMSLSVDDIENGVQSDRGTIDSFRIAANTAQSIDDVIDIIKSQRERWETREFAFGDVHGETENNNISAKKLIDSILLEAQIYKLCAGRINALAKEGLTHFSEKAQSDFLEKFGSLFSSLDFNYHIKVKDDIALKESLREAMTTCDFGHVTALAFDSVKRGLYTGIGPLISYSPMPVVRDVLLNMNSLSSNEVMLNHIESMFLNRCNVNKRHYSNKFTNINMDTLSSFFAAAELRHPGYGKDIDVISCAKQFWFDQDDFLHRYLSIVHDEKRRMIDAIPTVTDEDMSFLSSPSI